MWDIIACWPSARVGEVVTITCPPYFSYFSDHQKGKSFTFSLCKCTKQGITDVLYVLLNKLEKKKTNHHLNVCNFLYEGNNRFVAKKPKDAIAGLRSAVLSFSHGLTHLFILL